MDGVYGVELLRWAAGHAAEPGWVRGWQGIAALGAPIFFSVALPLLHALAPAHQALRLTLAFALSGAVSEWIKDEVGRPRLDPSDFGLPGALEPLNAFGSAAFPSGHVLMAVVLWGSIALHTRSHAVRVGCGLLVLLIGASRIVLLRHDLLDVGGGLVIGGALLALLVGAERAWGFSLAALPRVERAGLWVLAAVGLQVLIGLEVSAVVLGVAAGLGAGATLAAGQSARDRGPGAARGIVRAVLGLAGVALVRVWAEPGQGWGPALLFAVYAAAAVWVAGVVPLFTGGVWERSATPTD